MYFYNARYYDGEIGRFVTADQVIDGEHDTQGWNRYAYVKNNPVMYKDPTGNDVRTRQEERYFCQGANVEQTTVYVDGNKELGYVTDEIKYDIKESGGSYSTVFDYKIRITAERSEYGKFLKNKSKIVDGSRFVMMSDLINFEKGLDKERAKKAAVNGLLGTIKEALLGNVPGMIQEQGSAVKDIVRAMENYKKQEKGLTEKRLSTFGFSPAEKSENLSMYTIEDSGDERKLKQWSKFFPGEKSYDEIKNRILLNTDGYRTENFLKEQDAINIYIKEPKRMSEK